MMLPRALASVLALGLLSACGGGGDEEPAAPPPSSAEAPSGAPAAEAPAQGEAPSAPVSSVRTPAPVPATGCPATEPANVQLAGTIHTDRVEGRETWTLAGSPHRLPDGLTIAEGATLTIEPCVRIVVGDGHYVSVEDGATLLAAGEPEKPILFDSGATGEESRGVWTGLIFGGNARTTSKLHHVVIEEAGGSEGYPGAIYLSDGFALDARHVRIVRAKLDGVRVAGAARFASGSTDLTVTASGVAETQTAPVRFENANTVGSLPDGRYEGNVANDILVDAALVSSTQTWRNPGAGVRYVLAEGLQVEGPSGATLTVAPGTVLAFGPEKTLWVGSGADGAIVLDGGSDEGRIVLTSARTSPEPGDWAGIHFGESTLRNATKIAYVTIRYAGGTDGYDGVGCGDDAGGVITITSRDLGPRIDHVTFESLAPESIAIVRDFSAATATDYTAASLGMDFGGGQRCKQSLNRDAEGNCPDPVPACR